MTPDDLAKDRGVRNYGITGAAENLCPHGFTLPPDPAQDPWCPTCLRTLLTAERQANARLHADLVQGTQGEITALRRCFEHAVNTYPQSVLMPPALEQWWANWYREYIAANKTQETAA